MGMRKTRIDIIAKRGSEALVLGFKIYEGVHDAQFGNEKLHQYVIQALLQMPTKKHEAKFIPHSHAQISMAYSIVSQVVIISRQIFQIAI
jgi:hypothetical protein